MIEAPAYLKTPHYRLYKDTHDSELFYVDALQPSAVHPAGVIAWQTSPTLNQAYFVSEIQFGATEAGFQQAAGLLQDYQRTVPVPWESGPTYIWFKSPEGILVKGKTSAFGYHNAVMQGVASTDVISVPYVVSGELYFQAKLKGATVRAQGNNTTLQQLIAQLPLGKRAPWNATIADILLPILKELVEKEQFIIQAESVSSPIAGLVELKELVLMEWAVRTIKAASIESLALPAAQIESLLPTQDLLPDYKIHWVEGDLIPVRTVRTLCSQVVTDPPRDVSPEDEPETKHETKVILSAASDWSDFNYVQVQTSESDRTVTLTPAQAVQTIKVHDPSSITAIANVKGYGVDVAVEREVIGKDVIVHLQRLEEQAFLIKAERSLLEEVGDLQVSISHPALAQTLVPKADHLILSAKNGDLPTVSAAYRGLLWQASASEPYTVRVQFSSGVIAQWQDIPHEGDLTIESARLPLLRVVVIPQRTAARTTVEIGQGEAQTSLGTREISPDEVALWSYPPDQSLLWIRAQYHSPTQTPYWTAWHAITADRTVVAPRTKSRQVVIMAPSTLKQPLSVEIAPAIGEGGVAQIIVQAGQVTPLTLLDDEQGGQFQYRICTEDTNWSSWQILAHKVLKL